jgi:CheY-like chemotaxis protein
MAQPLAFLSYTRKDDDFFGGYITAFRKVLETAVHVVTGEETFRVFQDVEGIVIGENWKKKLDDVIHESSFLVPMLSPLFFSSGPCRDEVTEFLAHERSLSRDDLILPVYFLSSAKLEKDEEKDLDPIAKELAARQMFDWREKANVPLQEPAARGAIMQLAKGIASALDRLAKPAPKSAPKDTRDEPGPRARGTVGMTTLDELVDFGVHGNVKREEPAPRRVLWVDDRPDNNVVERRALESYGVQFALARDTERAQDLLSAKEPFSAVVSDLGRPGDRLAGVTLLRWLRQERGPIPYFIYTSRSAAKRRPGRDEPTPDGVTADPDRLVEMVVAALR